MGLTKDSYRRIKIAGLISYIPIVLFTAGTGSFFLGELLREKFKLPYFIIPACILLGVAVGITEVVRIIKLVLQIERKAKDE